MSHQDEIDQLIGANAAEKAQPAKDWAQSRASDILSYLAKCRSEIEELTLIAAYLRMTKSEGEIAGAQRLSDALDAIWEKRQ